MRPYCTGKRSARRFLSRPPMARHFAMRARLRRDVGRAVCRWGAGQHAHRAIPEPSSQIHAVFAT